MLGFDTASDYVRAYPVSREWLTLLNRRMDAVATIYLLVASPSPGADGLRTQVDFPPQRPVPRHHHAARGGLSFGLVRQGLALRRRSLYDRLRGIADATPGPAQRPPHFTPSPDPRGLVPGPMPR